MPKTALVTGGTGGIGRAIVSRLVEAGMNVVFTYNSDHDGAREIEQRFGEGRAKAYRCDLARTEDVKKFSDKVIEDLGSMDVLVNNAGTSRDRLFLRTTLRDWKEVMDVNLDGTFNVTKAFLPNMVRQRWGRVIFISSVSGLRGNVGQTSYASSKAALVGLAKSIAREVASRNITCNVVAPGLIDTAMTRKIKKEYLAKLMEMIPLGRMGSADEVASLVSYLVGDEASYITGQVMIIDGGLSI